MGKRKLATLQRLFESPQPPPNASHCTLSTLFNVVRLCMCVEGEDFYVLLFEVLCVHC